MSDGFEEDLDMYEEAQGPESKELDNRALLRPISDINYARSPVVVEPGTRLAEALETMARKRIGAVLVVDQGKVVGIFAERDLLIKRLYDGKGLDGPVRNFMTPDPECLTPHDPIAFALNRMVAGGYRHVPLITAEGAPVGILPMRDVVAYIVSFFPGEIFNVPPHSEHNPPDRAAEGG